MHHLNSKRLLSFRYTCASCMRIGCITIGSATHPAASATTEYALPSGARADVCFAGPTGPIIAVIEILATHRASGEVRADNQWFEVRAEDVLLALKANFNPTIIELECQRRDRCNCGHSMCLSMLQIAKRLQYRYLLEWYESENHREQDAAIRGRYSLPRWIWQPRPDFDDFEDSEKAMEKPLWREFLRRKQCICCRSHWQTGWRRPYCQSCYRQAREEDEEYEQHQHAWQAISQDEQARLRDKFAWLSDFAQPPNGDSCQICNDRLWTVPVPEWRGIVWSGNRRLCNECFASWTPAQTVEYVRKAHGIFEPGDLVRLFNLQEKKHYNGQLAQVLDAAPNCSQRYAVKLEGDASKHLHVKCINMCFSDGRY